jgi:hypothetical protein
VVPLVIDGDCLAASTDAVMPTKLSVAEKAVRDCFGASFADATAASSVNETVTPPGMFLMIFAVIATVSPTDTSWHAMCPAFS